MMMIEGTVGRGKSKDPFIPLLRVYRSAMIGKTGIEGARARNKSLPLAAKGHLWQIYFFKVDFTLVAFCHIVCLYIGLYDS